MCCKCLYVLLAIFIGILFYIFEPSEHWAEWITAISTFFTMIATVAMAIFAGKALYSWKNQQKREKLVDFLEFLNKSVQTLQYYEHEGTIFSKQARKNYNEDFKNTELILSQVKIIDIELAELSGKCSWRIKNWIINNEEQANIANDLIEKINSYRFAIFDYIKIKIKYYTEPNNSADILYDCDNIKTKLSQEIEDFKPKLENLRNQVLKQINIIKKQNKKLLK